MNIGNSGDCSSSEWQKAIFVYLIRNSYMSIGAAMVWMVVVICTTCLGGLALLVWYDGRTKNKE